MAESFTKFNFNTLEELKDKIRELGLELPVSDDLSILGTPVKIGGTVSPNRFAVLPMEGCDSEPDGSPSELVQRRYRRLAEGGSGLIWWEACAVTPEARANPRQMMLTEQNWGKFRALLEDCRSRSQQENGFQPVNVLQLTHSGRYSRPYTHKNEPIIPQHDPYLDPRVGVGADDPVVSDEYLEALPEKFARSARLAREAGFDGIDVKSCHRYLFSELLASHTREGKYGGSFENRTRLLREAIRAVKKEVGDDFLVACRFNIFDAHPYPYGFGCARDDMWTFDPREPEALVKMLVSEGVGLLSNSAGNPYYLYPQVTRPFDTSSMGIPEPKENQLKSIERLFRFTELVQRAAGDIPVVGNGYSWLRFLAPYAGAANILAGRCGLMGLGRSSFAYPDAPRDILQNGHMDPSKCCIACSKCTQIMRDHGSTGCVVRDGGVYLEQYRKARKEAEERERSSK